MSEETLNTSVDDEYFKTVISSRESRVKEAGNAPQKTEALLVNWTETAIELVPELRRITTNEGGIGISEGDTVEVKGDLTTADEKCGPTVGVRDSAIVGVATRTTVGDIVGKEVGSMFGALLGETVWITVGDSVGRAKGL